MPQDIAERCARHGPAILHRPGQCPPTGSEYAMETIDLQGSLPLNLWSYALLNFVCWLGIVIWRPGEAKGKPHPEDDRMRVTCFHNLLWLDDRHGPIYLFGATAIIRYVRGSGLR